MITLVTGGSKCGKSSLAEKILDFKFNEKLYIATMIPSGEEAIAAIENHRRMREKKSFETIEKYTDIHEIKISKSCSILLECIGNLCANEMFSGDKIKYPADKIIMGIKHLSTAENLVIVTNEVCSDGTIHTPETQLYQNAMAEINAGISELADNVIECVYGIPVILKGEIPC